MTSASLRVYDNRGTSVTLVHDGAQSQTTMVVTFHRVNMRLDVDESVIVSGTVRRYADGTMEPQRVWAKNEHGSTVGDLDFNRDNAYGWANATADAIIIKMNDLADEFVHSSNDDRLRAEIEKNEQAKTRERIAKQRAEQDVIDRQRRQARTLSLSNAEIAKIPASLLAGVTGDGALTIALEQHEDTTDTYRLLGQTKVDDDRTLENLRDLVERALVLRQRSKTVRFDPNQPRTVFPFIG